MDDSSANLNAIISVLGGELMSGRNYPELGVVAHLHEFFRALSSWVACGP